MLEYVVCGGRGTTLGDVGVWRGRGTIHAGICMGGRGTKLDYVGVVRQTTLMGGGRVGYCGRHPQSVVLLIFLINFTYCEFVVVCIPAQIDPDVSLSKLSPFKRPRSLSHDKDALGSSDPDQSVQVEIVLDEDDLELGESCGQAKLRGRVEMPVCEPEEVQGSEFGQSSEGVARSVASGDGGSSSLGLCYLGMHFRHL